LSVQTAEGVAGNDDKSRDEDAMRRGESEEKGEEESGRKAKKIPGFNWAEDVDTSIRLIDIGHNKLTPLTNINMYNEVFPIIHSTTVPTTLTVVTSIGNPKAVVNLVNTTANTPTNTIPIPCNFSTLCSSAPFETHGAAYVTTSIITCDLTSQYIRDNVCHQHTLSIHIQNLPSQQNP
jgi:hypothetical protein